MQQLPIVGQGVRSCKGANGRAVLDLVPRVGARVINTLHGASVGPCLLLA